MSVKHASGDAKQELDVWVWSSGEWVELGMGRGLGAGLGDTATLTSGKEIYKGDWEGVKKSMRV